MKVINQAIKTIAGMDEEKTSYGSGGLFGNTFHRAFFSLCLTTITPIFVICMWNCCKNFDGSISLFLGTIISSKGNVIWNTWPTGLLIIITKIKNSYDNFVNFIYV